MINTHSQTTLKKRRIALVTCESDFAELGHATLGVNPDIDLVIINGPLLDSDTAFKVKDAAAVIVDLKPTQEGELVALQDFLTQLDQPGSVIAVIPSLDEFIIRRLWQMRISDFLVKPVNPIDLTRAAAGAMQSSDRAAEKNGEIYTFVPSAGGAGATTLAIQTAIALIRNGDKARPSTCLIDLDFQHGACADYLDLLPRLNLDELEPSPERLDRQLLEAMLSHHTSGLSVLAAPNHPAEPFSINQNVLLRILNLISSSYDNVVIDLPSNWFSWTNNVLHGSNKLYVVSDASVPGLKRANHFVSKIQESLNHGPQPRIIVNRFQYPIFGAGLRQAELKKILGEAFHGTIPYNYQLVREAIDRGVPLEEIRPKNNITASLKKLLFQPSPHTRAGLRAIAPLREHALSPVQPSFVQ